MTSVAAVGEAMIELSLDGSVAKVGVAGDTLNTAVYLKREAPDAQVDYVTCLGDDPFSDQIEGFISEQNIGTGQIKRLKGRSPGLYAITTTADGERSFTYWRSASAAREMFKSETGYDFSILETYDLIYLSGISVAIMPATARQSLLNWLAETPVKLAYDSNYRPRLWEDQDTARKTSTAFWKRADICLPSIDDEMELFDETETEVIERFKNYNGYGALKQGAQGPISLGSDVEQSYAPAEKVLDTTAAGDSFNGGYLSAIIRGASQAVALRSGHDCAARVVQFRGAIVPMEDK